MAYESHGYPIECMKYCYEKCIHNKEIKIDDDNTEKIECHNFKIERDGYCKFNQKNNSVSI